MENNLWPSLAPIDNIVTPKRILQEQGIYLEKTSSNFLKVKINSFTEEDRMKFSHKFEIIAPFLSDYSFTLLKVTHDILLYPLTINFVLVSEEYPPIGNEDKFKQTLRDIFSNDRTTEVIRNLLAQSKSTVGDTPVRMKKQVHK